MRTRLVKATAAALAAAMLLGGCGSGTSAAEQVDLNSLSLDEIVEKAKEEGEVNSVGMPDDWATGMIPGPDSRTNTAWSTQM